MAQSNSRIAFLLCEMYSIWRSVFLLGMEFGAKYGQIKSMTERHPLRREEQVCDGLACACLDSGRY